MKRKCTKFDKPNVITSSSLAIAMIDVLWVILNQNSYKNICNFLHFLEVGKLKITNY